jgi:hypothetical protein
MAHSQASLSALYIQGWLKNFDLYLLFYQSRKVDISYSPNPFVNVIKFHQKELC